MNMVEYYSARAREYESIYAKPERQSDLRELERLITPPLAGKDILEIACGTGYWTAKFSAVAGSITAFDINESVLEIARSKPLPKQNVRWLRADSYDFPEPGQKFSAGLAGFWLSHVPREKQPDFFRSFLPYFAPGSPLVFFDNNYVENSSTPIAERDPAGNTYQKRALQDGNSALVLKNFFTQSELERIFREAGLSPEIHMLDYYWIVIAG